MLILVFNFVNGAEIRVAFNEGFVGVNAANNKSTSANYLTSYGWSKFKFTQTSNTGVFVEQGNDIIGNVVITDANNVIHTIPGYIKWRAPSGSVSTIVFTPTSTKILATNTGTYTIDGTKYIGLTFIGRTLTIATSGGGAYEVTGNAATSGLLTELNNYLTTFQANDPLGPVTINALTTSDQTPTINGTVTLRTGETLTINVNGVDYTTTNGLSVSGGTWSLTIPTNINFNTYDVLATITNTDGYTLNDNTTDELIITQPPAGLTYTSPNVYTVGVTIGTLTPTSTGGAITSYSVSPSLPASLSINATTGVITGTPSAVSSQTSYVVTGTNAVGTVTATVVMTVNIAPPLTLSYTSPNVYTVGVAISTLSPSRTGGAIASYAVSPSLPAGLSINPTTGLITGTPSATSSQTS